jgi:hypothetical protein
MSANDFRDIEIDEDIFLKIKISQDILINCTLYKKLIIFKKLKNHKNAMAEKMRYSDEELDEFRQLILQKLEKAKQDYELLKSSITMSDNNDTQDTSPYF